MSESQHNGSEADILSYGQVNLFSVFYPYGFRDDSEDLDFRQFKRGEFIYFSDDPSNTIYLIAEGKVKILYYTDDGNEVIKSILVKGDIFGELSLLGEERRKDYAMAAQHPTSIYLLTIEQMEEFMKENRELARSIHKLIGLRIRKLERRVDALIFKDVRTRMLEFIQEFAEEKGVPAGNSYHVNHLLTHKDIADLIGTTRQTVTTMLNELRNEGKIDFTRRNLYIPDIGALS